MPGTVHIVTLWHARYSQGDTLTDVAAAFTDEEKAGRFVRWAESWRKRILEEYKALQEQEEGYVSSELLYGALDVPQLIREMIPDNWMGSDHVWFQVDDEVDLDPEFEKEETP